MCCFCVRLCACTKYAICMRLYTLCVRIYMYLCGLCMPVCMRSFVICSACVFSCAHILRALHAWLRACLHAIVCTLHACLLALVRVFASAYMRLLHALLHLLVRTLHSYSRALVCDFTCSCKRVCMHLYAPCAFACACACACMFFACLARAFSRTCAVHACLLSFVCPYKRSPCVFAESLACACMCVCLRFCVPCLAAFLHVSISLSAVCMHVMWFWARLYALGMRLCGCFFFAVACMRVRIRLHALGCACACVRGYIRVHARFSWHLPLFFCVTVLPFHVALSHTQEKREKGGQRGRRVNQVVHRSVLNDGAPSRTPVRTHFSVKKLHDVHSLILRCDWFVGLLVGRLVCWFVC